MAASDILTKLMNGAPQEDTETINVSSFKNEAERVAEFEKMFNDIKSKRIPFERQWLLNTAFYFGKQYVSWVNAGSVQRLREEAAPSHRVRLVINKCKVTVRTEMAKLLKERPRGFVVPNTSDDLDKAAARHASKLYDSLEKPEALGIQKRLRDSVFWLSVLGNGFQKIYYDKNAKDFTGTPGAITVEARSPFSIYVPDLLEVDIERQAYVIDVLTKSVDWVKDNYGVIVQPDNAASLAGVDQRMLSAIGLTQERATKDLVTIKEIWIKPCTKHPNGLFALWTADKLLTVLDKWPYAHGQYPFVKYDHIPTGRFYSDSTLVDMLVPQKEYNRSISQLIENRNLMSRPQWAIQRGSVDVNKMNSQPGLIIEYMIGTPAPVPIQPPGLPGYVSDLITRMQSDMNDISGQHEVTKGSTPPGVTAATAISFLQEEDDSKLALTVTSIEEGVQKVACQVLSLVSQFWATERQISVTGESNTAESRAFSQATLRGNTDYRVEFGSASPTSRAAKQALLLELLDRQAISPDDLLRYLDMQASSAIYDNSQKDSRQAQKENMLLTEAQPQIIHPWDNDIMHLTTHQDYMKTEQYDLLDPQIQQLFVDHIKLHKSHVAAMYGRYDLLPTALVDPRNPGQPIVDPATGKTRMTPDNPELDGYVEGIKVHGPPPPMPPQPPMPLDMGIQDAKP